MTRGGVFASIVTLLSLLSVAKQGAAPASGAPVVGEAFYSDLSRILLATLITLTAWLLRNVWNEQAEHRQQLQTHDSEIAVLMDRSGIDRRKTDRRHGSEE